MMNEKQIKNIFITAVAVMAIPSAMLGQAASQNTSCEITAKELEAKVTEITQNLDKAAFEQFVSDDALIIQGDGRRKRKSQQVASSFNPPPNLAFSFTTKDINVRACGETSIVTTGKDIVTFTKKGSKKSEIQYYYFTRAYEKREGKWQLVFHQLTRTINYFYE
jgi:ketosteroid isomerase-like protein